MTAAERWKVINDVPAGDIIAAMKAIGEMVKAGGVGEATERRDAGRLGIRLQS